VLQSLLNNVGFWCRSSIQWSRGDYNEKNETKNNLFDGRVNEKYLSERESELRNKYAMDYLYRCSTKERYLESITYLEHLEQIFSSATVPKNISWLDVGVKNWSYVEGVYRFIQRNTKHFTLHGIELDAFRMYRNLYSRIDYARSFIRHLQNTSFEIGDALHHQKKYNIVSCFLPFIFIEPTLAWGLPEKYFQPLQFISHLVSLLEKDGILIIVNQNEDENEEQRTIFQKCFSESELIIEWNGKLQESFFPFKYLRYGWRCRRK
jgi:hypothetical protein